MHTRTFGTTYLKTLLPPWAFEGGREQAISMLRDVLSNGLLSKSVHDLKRAHALLSNAGVVLENTGSEPLVTLRYFGPDACPDAPEVGAHKNQ